LLPPLDDVVYALGRSNILPQVQRVCVAGGHTFGLPHAVATSLLIYRKDLADKAGIEAPQSWPDVVAVAKAMTRDTNDDGKIDIYGVSIPGDNLFINIILGELAPTPSEASPSWSCLRRARPKRRSVAARKSARSKPARRRAPRPPSASATSLPRCVLPPAARKRRRWAAPSPASRLPQTDIRSPTAWLCACAPFSSEAAIAIA
jgi:hypothetical protein